MSDLRSKLIRLAHSNPELRDDLLPLIKEAARGSQIWARYNKMASKCMKDANKLKEAWVRHTGYKGNPKTLANTKAKMLKIIQVLLDLDGKIQRDESVLFFHEKNRNKRQAEQAFKNIGTAAEDLSRHAKALQTGADRMFPITRWLSAVGSFTSSVTELYVQSQYLPESFDSPDWDKAARAVNPDTTSWNNLSRNVTEDLHQAMHSLEDLSFTMDSKWDNYLGEGSEVAAFLKTRSEVVAAIRGLNKVEKAWRGVLLKMR